MRQRLPEGIATRAKQGFSIPMKNWIRGELLELTRDEVFSSTLIDEHFCKNALETMWQEHQQRRDNHSHLFWTLLNISLWERLLLNGPQPQAMRSGVAPSLSTSVTAAAGAAITAASASTKSAAA